LSSQDLESSNWFKGNTTVTANTTAAPDGTTTADTVAFAAVANANIQPNVAVTTTAGLVYTYSVYLRAASTVSNVRLSMQGSDTNTTITTDWQRFTMTVTASGATLAPTLVTRDSVAVSIQVWGAQLELGSTATTYNNTSVRNLLGFSEAFNDATWTKGGASIVTGAQANPVNGLFNAQKLMENTAAATQHYVARSVTALTSNTPITLSVYARAGERRYIALLEGASNKGQYFDLQTGTVGSVLTAAPTSASITSVGNGWYRCSITIPVLSTTASLEVYLSNSGASISYTGDGNSGVYIYGAQLSNSASLDPYVPTPGAAPSSTAYYGPRFDYDPVTLAPRGLLVEEARTNSLTYSQDLSNAAWTKGGLNTISASATVSPDGTATGNKLTPNTTNTTHFANASPNFNAAINQPVTHSCFVKSDGYNKLALRESAVTGAYATFDLATASVIDTGNAGGIVVSNVSIINVGNGWYRVAMTCLNATSTQGNGFGLWLLPPNYTGGAGVTSSWIGNGTSGVFVWGAQLEAGAFATSYIPTVASTVTRSADVATISGQNFGQWYGQPEGTFVVEYRQGEGTTARSAAVANDGTNNNTIELYIDGSTDATTLPFYGVYVGGVAQAALSFAAAAANSNHKMAGAYRTNDFAASVDGSSVATDTSGTLPTPTRLTIGANGPATGSFANGHIRSINYVPARAADFQLQALST